MTRRSRLRVDGHLNGDAGMSRVVDLGTWPTIDELALSADRRALYRRRERAIRLYLEGATDSQIKTACGISRGQTYRLLTERCLKQHPDGHVYGWRGLLPHARVKSYQRTAPLELNAWSGGAVGALQWLFESRAGRGLEDRLRERILGKRSELEASRRPRMAVFRWFLAELRERGVELRGEWPFNVEKRGYETLARYIDRVLAESPTRAKFALIVGARVMQRCWIATYPIRHSHKNSRWNQLVTGICLLAHMWARLAELAIGNNHLATEHGTLRRVELHGDVEPIVADRYSR